MGQTDLLEDLVGMVGGLEGDADDLDINSDYPQTEDLNKGSTGMAGVKNKTKLNN